MGFFYDSFLSALLLIVSMNEELLQIVATSLSVSVTSTAVSALLGVPGGFLLAMRAFRGKRAVITLLNTLLSLPTVVVGLLVYVFISRQGLFGSLGLLYTSKAMIIGQIVLVLPIIVTFTHSAVSRIDDRYAKTAMTLGADAKQLALAVLREARFGICAAVIAAFGRVIAEIGVSMMLGGNIKGFTRTMTTSMALEYDKGEFTLAVALGLVLLAVSFAVNIVFNAFQGRTDT
jgi:tungstate transport system permease protein